MSRYNRTLLFNLRNSMTYAKISQQTAAVLKSLHIFKARGTRAGELVKQRVSRIPVLTAPIVSRHSRFSASSYAVGARQPSIKTTKKALQVASSSSKNNHNLIQIVRLSALDTKAQCNNAADPLPCFFLANLRSVNNKFDQLSVALSRHSPDVAVLTETWLTTDTTDFVTVQGYQHFNVTRDARRGGGVSVFIKDHYSSQCVDTVLSPDIEVVSVKVSLKRMQSTPSLLFLLAVYRPPQGDNNSCLTYLYNTLSSFHSDYPGCKIVVTGDLNRADLTPIFQEFGLVQTISFNTRGNAVLDIFATNFSDLYKPPEKHAPVGNSDHCTVCISPLGNKVKPIKAKSFVFDKRRQFVVKGHNYLHNVDWNNLFGSNDPNTITDILFDHLLEVVKVFPKRVVVRSSSDPKWLTDTIRLLQKRCNKAFLSQNMPLFHQLTEELNTAIRNSKSSLMNKTNSGSSDFWKLINSRRKCSTPLYSSFFLSEFPTLADAANEFNKSILHRFPTPCPLSECSLPTLSTNSDIPNPVSPFEILRVIGMLKSSSSGPDQIPGWIYKTFDIELAKPIAHLCTMSMSQGIFPDALKKSIVIPIPKINSPKDVSDFRPISLTSFLAKILEKVVQNRVFHTCNGVIKSSQHAYRPFASTTTALTELTHRCLKFLDGNSGSVIRMALLDYSKAFDAINPSLLTGKIVSYGLPDWLSSWTWSFLNDRRQSVRIGTFVSDAAPVYRGIPQGTVMGPLLFLLMINDFSVLNANQTFIVSYADDQTLCYREVKDESSCPSFLDEITNVLSWCKINEMKLNLSKTKEVVLALSNKSRANFDLAEIKVENMIIERVKSSKVLGITIDENLGWNQHVDNVVSKCRSLLYLLRQLKQSYQLQSERIVYLIKALVIPTLLYAFPSWCNVNQSEVEKLYKVYKNAYHIAGISIQYDEFVSLLDSLILNTFRKSSSNPRHPLNKFIPLLIPHNYPTRRRSLPHVVAKTTKYHNHLISKAVRLVDNHL